MKEALNKFLNDFDIGALLPNLTKLSGWIEAIMRLAVMVGPIVLLVLGLLYLASPPKEANHSAGFRCWWGMASLDAWQFTQKAAGITWTVLGTVLTVVMAIKSARLAGLELPVMLDKAVVYLIWQLVLTVASVIGVNIAAIVVFDRRGFRRRER